MGLSEEHIVDICKRRRGMKTCRYLDFASDGWVCSRLASVQDLLALEVTDSDIKFQYVGCGGVNYTPR
ncbi:MAG: hypothetical protein HQ536_00735 [Parcubacteria group bacterium]|nr:hypothetical protein [Parcubacteria group bacterium]